MKRDKWNKTKKIARTDKGLEACSLKVGLVLCVRGGFWGMGWQDQRGRREITLSETYETDGNWEILRHDSC